MNHKSRKIYYAAAALLWIVIWQVAATYVNRRLLIPIPTPVSTAAALIRLSADRSFFHAVFLSILRITVGFLSAFVVGTLLAVLSVKSEFVHVLTAPLLQLIRAIPVASFTILVFLWVTRERIPSEKRAALTGVLANDPRPRYQNDPERVYGLRFAGRNVKFRVADGELTVLAVEEE